MKNEIDVFEICLNDLEVDQMKALIGLLEDAVDYAENEEEERD